MKRLTGTNTALLKHHSHGDNAVLIDTTAALTTSNPVIDQDHASFIELVNKMETANDREFVMLFNQLLIHTSEHFESENQLMAQSAFPAINEHQGEHHRVLAEFKQFQKRVDRGLLAFGRSYVTDSLPQWFTLHVTTMDSALAAHINKHSTVNL